MSLHVLLRHWGRICLGATLVACADHSIVAPEIEHVDGGVQARQAKPAKPAKLLKRSSHLKRSIVVSTTITPDRGGALSIPEAGLVVMFPAGAVRSALTVTVTAQAGDNVVYTFEPHGTVFAKPIRIAQLLSVTKYFKRNRAATPDLHGGYLVRGLDDVDADGNGMFSETFRTSYSDPVRGTYAVFQTGHFSGYALASGRAEIDIEVPIQ